MTKESNDFYKQLMANEHVSISGLLNDEDGIQAIRWIARCARWIKPILEAILKDNPYVKDVYPDEESRKDVVALQVYEGHGSYMNLKAHSKGTFDFSAE